MPDHPESGAREPVDVGGPDPPVSRDADVAPAEVIRNQDEDIGVSLGRGLGVESRAWRSPRQTQDDERHQAAHKQGQGLRK
jgi:hypothetical protein